jgi:hypothetical protein
MRTHRSAHPAIHERLRRLGSSAPSRPVAALLVLGTQPLVRGAIKS